MRCTLRTTMKTAEQLRTPLLDVHEAAAFLKVSRSWIYARVERNEMPHIRVGGLIRFVPAQLRDWTFAKDQGKT
jgi:excisionase family DNA binding protein